MSDFTAMPIYYVIAEQDRASMRYQILNVIEVIECDITDLESSELYARIDAMRQYPHPRNIYTYIFRRVPGNTLFVPTPPKQEFTMDIPLAPSSTDNPYESLQAYIGSEGKEEGEREEAPYHERIWNDD